MVQAEPLREFVDVSNDPGLGILPYVAPLGMAAGLAAADYDDDGDIDIFVPNRVGVADQLYQNQGDGSFLEIAGQVGLGSLGRSKVALWFDADNDNLLDLLVGSDCSAGEGPVADSACFESPSLFFYRQLPSGQFIDDTAAAGFADTLIDPNHPHRGGMCAGDINNDGFLDVLVTAWKFHEPAANTQIQQLFLNNGDRTFSDITAAAQFSASSGGSWQPMMADFDEDGFIDIYAAIDFSGNRLWMNNQDNTFTDQAAGAGLDSAWNDMGVALGDYDNDRDLDIYVTNIYEPGTKHNILLQNNSDPNGPTLSYSEVSQAAGCSQGHWGWGCTFLDMENNGLLDIAATNGFFPIWNPDPSVFYRNSGNGPNWFSDASADVGFDDDLWGSALIAMDYNRDGWLDLVQTTMGPTQPNKVRLLENRLRTTADPNDLVNNTLVVRPRICGINRRAIGATVEIVAGDLTLMRLISAGCSLLGQEPAEANFGLGANTVVDTLTIRWPSGQGATLLSNVSANQVLTVHKPAPGDINSDFKVDLRDAADLANQWMQSGPGLSADLTQDQTVDLDDLKRVATAWLAECW
jgi:hypothetical protein